MLLPKNWHTLALDQKFAYALALAQERRDARKPECRKTAVVSKSGKVLKPATIACGSTCRQPKNCGLSKAEKRRIQSRVGTDPDALRRAIVVAKRKKRQGRSGTGAVYEATKEALGAAGQARNEKRKARGEKVSPDEQSIQAQFRANVPAMVERLQTQVDNAESDYKGKVAAVKEKHNKAFKKEAGKIYPKGDPNQGTKYEGRDLYEDGFVIPQPGEEVEMWVRSFLGTGSKVKGKVYKGKNGVRVKVTSQGVGGATYTDLDGWRLADDPEHDRKTKVREIQIKHQKRAQEEIDRIPGYQDMVDAAVEEIKKAALQAGYQEKNTEDVQIGDHILDLSGARGEIYYALGLAGQSEKSSALGDGITVHYEDMERSTWHQGSVLVAPATPASSKKVRDYITENDRLRAESDREFEERESARMADLEKAEQILAEERRQRLAGKNQDPSPSKPRKKSKRKGASKPPVNITQTTGNPEMDARLARYRDRVAKGRPMSASEENSLKVLERREKADPKKWPVGEGVGHIIGVSGKSGQINRGFRIIETDPESKRALIRSVADTGLTVSGGDDDKISDTWVHIGDLVRDKKYRSIPQSGGKSKLPSEQIQGKDFLKPGMFTKNESGRISFIEPNSGMVMSLKSSTVEDAIQEMRGYISAGNNRGFNIFMAQADKASRQDSQGSFPVVHGYGLNPNPFYKPLWVAMGLQQW